MRFMSPRPEPEAHPKVFVDGAWSKLYALCLLTRFATKAHARIRGARALLN